METKDKELPKVSVAVITYNQKDLLRETIESILMQEYPNLEIIVADDGSGDGTHQMLMEYEKKYPNLFKLLLSSKNQGITVNSNIAFSACTGDYIAWIGGDDLMLPGKIRKQVEFFSNHPECAMCVTDAEVFESETGKTICINSSVYKGKRFYGPETIIKNYNGIVASTVMVRRSSCPPHGFDSRIPIASDFLFNVETAMNGQVGVLDETLCRYRIHQKSVTNQVKFYNGDPFITLGIIEYKYPTLIKHVKRLRAYYFYSMGLTLTAQENIKMAREYFWNAFLLDLINWKSFASLIFTFLPLGLRKFIISTIKRNLQK